MGPSTAVTRKLCAQVLEDTMKGITMSCDGTLNISTKNRINVVQSVEGEPSGLMA